MASFVQKNDAHPWTLRQMTIALYCHPSLIAEAHQKNALPFRVIFRYTATFALMVGVLFSLMTIVFQPATLQLGGMQIASRVLVWTALASLLLCPVYVVLTGALLRIAAWFYDVPMSFAFSAGLMGLSLWFVVLMLLASLPLKWLQPLFPLGFELLLALLALAAIGCTLRLIQKNIGVLTGFSGRKALFVAFFPVILVIIVVLMTWVLAWFAAYHRGSSH